MTKGLSKLAARVQRRYVVDSVDHGGLILPAGHLRTGGPDFQDNDYYIRSARAEADRLIQSWDLTTTTRLLDVGCGTGRLAIGFLSCLGDMTYYRGLDVNPASVQWCTHHINALHHGFQFIRVDVQNTRYNPAGQQISEQLRLPFSAGEFEGIYLYSVFSHMEMWDIQHYLAEFYRLLKPGGRVFLTAFVEEHVPDMSVNPENYRRNWQGALHCVRFEQHFFETLLTAPGFRIDRFDYGQETDGQSAFYLSLPDRNVHQLTAR